MMGVLFIHASFEYTSTNQFCDVCHVHPHVTQSWRESTHYKNESGVIVHCVECHLPPDGVSHYTEKVRVGIRDVWGTIFKDVSNIDWEAKGRLEHAKKFTYEASCTHCHGELFSMNLSKKGTDAHVYYFHKKGEVRCINCHLTVGHFQEKPSEEEMILAERAEEKKRITFPPKPSSKDIFADYSETIPGTTVQFEMVAIPGGTFFMGSLESEPYRETDEGPVRKVKISPFWMGRIEVSWDEWEVYYARTATRGKLADAGNIAALDVVTGPTPPYGSPDQGWGKGTRPAVTMTHHAAMKYCEWLSNITGDHYRLPTEAEWEYACRASTSGPYFFEAKPSKLTQNSWLNKIFGADTSVINTYVWYAGNSRAKTNPAYSRQPNPYGLINMLGNVREFCLDWYDPKAYHLTAADTILINPIGPVIGTEHVIRGGSFKSDAADLRCARRDHTWHDAWMLTDPQSPKSSWWYSDCNDVGFRVVREYEGD